MFLRAAAATHVVNLSPPFPCFSVIPNPAQTLLVPHTSDQAQHRICTDGSPCPPPAPAPAGSRIDADERHEHRRHRRPPQGGRRHQQVPPPPPCSRRLSPPRPGPCAARPERTRVPPPALRRRRTPARTMTIANVCAPAPPRTRHVRLRGCRGFYCGVSRRQGPCRAMPLRAWRLSGGVGALAVGGAGGVF